MVKHCGVATIQSRPVHPTLPGCSYVLRALSYLRSVSLISTRNTLLLYRTLTKQPIVPPCATFIFGLRTMSALARHNLTSDGVQTLSHPPATKKRKLNFVKCQMCRNDKQGVSRTLVLLYSYSTILKIFVALRILMVAAAELLLHDNALYINVFTTISEVNTYLGQGNYRMDNLSQRRSYFLDSNGKCFVGQCLVRNFKHNSHVQTMPYIRQYFHSSTFLR